MCRHRRNRHEEASEPSLTPIELLPETTPPASPPSTSVVLSPLADLFPHELFPHRPLVLVLGAAVSPFVAVIVQGGAPKAAAAAVAVALNEESSGG